MISIPLNLIEYLIIEFDLKEGSYIDIGEDFFIEAPSNTFYDSLVVCLIKQPYDASFECCPHYLYLIDMKLVVIQDVVELINGESIEWVELPDVRLYVDNPDEQTFHQIDMYIEKDSILGNYYFVGAYND